MKDGRDHNVNKSHPQTSQRWSSPLILVTIWLLQYLASLLLIICCAGELMNCILILMYWAADPQLPSTQQRNSKLVYWNIGYFTIFMEEAKMKLGHMCAKIITDGRY